MTRTANVLHPHGEPSGSPWSWWERHQRARDLHGLQQLRAARSAAFGHYAQELLIALHQPRERWLRTVGLLADQVSRSGGDPWFWHAVLRRGYALDTAAIQTCPADWSTCTSRELFRRRDAMPPTVQRWLWTAVHANDVWLADRALNDGARANAVLMLPAGDAGGIPETSALPMTWLLDARDHGGLEASWVHRTGKTMEQWPSTWRFWWSSARTVDDLQPMLATLSLPRRGEDLDHHGFRPMGPDLLEIQVEGERRALRQVVASVEASGLSTPALHEVTAVLPDDGEAPPGRAPGRRRL